MHLAQELLTNVQCSGGSRSLQRKQEPWRWGAWWPAIRSWQRSTERIIEADPLTTHEKLPKNSISTILWSFSIWSKLERWKSSINGCLVNWPKSKKIIILKCCLLLFYGKTMNYVSIGLWHAMKSEFFVTTGDNQFSDRTEKKLQSTSPNQTYTIKRS